MKKVLAGLLVAVIVSLLCVGCPRAKKPAGPPPPEPPGAFLMAADIQSPVPPYESMQWKDPVNGEQIVAQFYYDLDGKRVYFSSAESRDEFASNPQKYLNNLTADAQAR